MNPLMRPLPHPAVRIHCTIPGVKINAGRLRAMWGRGGVGGGGADRLHLEDRGWAGHCGGGGAQCEERGGCITFFCYDSHHLGHCSGPLLHVGVRLYEPVNAAFATPCSEDPLHHPWCEDQCGGGGRGGGCRVSHSSGYVAMVYCVLCISSLILTMRHEAMSCS